MSEKVTNINSVHKVYAPYFGSNDHKNCKVAVVYPYYYREVDNTKTFCLPYPAKSVKDLNKNNFRERNAVWFSKNSHENPDYLLLSLEYAINHVKKCGGRLIIIDGHRLVENEYKGSKEVKTLLRFEKNSIWWNYRREWLSYDKMQMILSKSKFITGIHHPVCSPMTSEIPFYGGIPILFQNQYELPPYNKQGGMCYIEFDNLKESVQNCYDILDDYDEYTKMLDACKTCAANYSDENFLSEFNKFIIKLNFI